MRDAFPIHFASAGKTILAILALAGLAGCASMPAGQGSPDDPLEPLNRKVFAFNDALDDAVIKPVAKAYLAVVPPFVRDRIRAMIDNLAEPRIFVNDVLQARVNAAGTTFARFVVNTVAGIGGMFDVASLHGLPKQTGDFGQTLYAWGVTDGPYLVLVFFGPSDVRDAFGLGVDLATTPPALVFHGHDANVASFAVGVVDGIDLRSRNIDALDAIKASSLDYYTHFKSIWRQHRAATLREGRGLPPTPPELIDPGATTPSDPQSQP
ncbi:MAG TPA: VacJ family lipoprotein [Casimicrobiaceae bacterium]|nr:VacJ family lipoprotein [Casimicrobiaceae bacterium]